MTPRTPDFQTCLTDAKRRLRAAGCDTPELDADLLYARALNTDRGGLLLRRGGTLTAEEYAAAEALIRRREQKEPVAYLLGEKEFYSLTFEVTPATLIPRPDSECVVDEALNLLAPSRQDARVLDIGTGSGCLLIAVLAHRPHALGAGTDLSAAALSVARRNAAHLLGKEEAARRAFWFLSDAGLAAQSSAWDLILANPPYIPEGDLLARDVAGYEPHSALFSGKDGLNAMRVWLPCIRALLRGDESAAIVEFGAGQEEAVAALALQSGLTPETFLRDGGGRIRAMRCRRREAPVKAQTVLDAPPPPG